MALPMRPIDHVAMTVADVPKSVAWYKDVMGATLPRPAYVVDGKLAVQPIVMAGVMLNLHQKGNGIWLVAKEPTVGSVDICFRWDDTIEAAQAHLASKNVPIFAGPMPTIGSDQKPSISVYFLDPDGNLLEFLTSVNMPAA